MPGMVAPAPVSSGPGSSGAESPRPIVAGPVPPVPTLSVLVVDDEPDACDVLARLLARAGHRARCVPNGREALAAVVAGAYDVVVLDLLMPAMDGPTFLDIVRSYLRLQSLPVVVLTAAPDGPLADRARQHGVAAVLAKGAVTPDNILRAVQAAARRTEADGP